MIKKIPNDKEAKKSRSLPFVHWSMNMISKGENLKDEF